MGLECVCKQQLRAQGALAENPGSIPSFHREWLTTAWNSTFRDSDSFWFTLFFVHIHVNEIMRAHTHTHTHTHHSP